VCNIIAADIPGNLWCLDQQRFLLVIPASLAADQRAAIARRAFAEAGQSQDADGVICVCGLEAEMPVNAPPTNPFRFLTKDALTPAVRSLVSTGALVALWEPGR
jgi:hypothetical protein